MAEDIRISLLGPVSAARGGAVIDLGSPRRQAVLAILASRAGRVVPMNRLVDGVWGDQPPRTAEQSVYTYVAGLRKVLEPSRSRRERSGLLAGDTGGYVLRLDPHQVDTTLFLRHVEAAGRSAGTGAHDEALRLLDAALSLWRGEPLTGLSGPFADAERARLTDHRLTAAEYRAEALLRLDRPHDALMSVRDLTRRHPIRERLRELLMLALFQCGRRAEALAAFEEGRRVLRDELGVDPGESLRRSHALVLRGEPTPPSRPAPEEPTAPTVAFPAAPDETPNGPATASPAGPAEPAQGPDEPVGRPDEPAGGSADGRAQALGAQAPRQLPRDLAGFVGRAKEIIRLKSLLAPWDGAPPSPLVAISGPPGVGKSALAIRIANLVRDRFPDGQLYVNLRGATVNLPALSPLDVLGRFLRALGTNGEAVPAEVDEAAALWRSRLAGRRMLVLLDDAAGLGQIQPLLSAPGATFLVTSRETLAAGDDCAQLHLSRMPLSEAVTVLAKLAGAGRVGADPAETAWLVRLCDGLPLALRIAGARLADRPGWSVSTLTGRLRDEHRRLQELEAGELAVRASLAASWSALSDGARPLDRTAAHTMSLLGLLHVHDLTAEVAGALLGTGVDEAERALERLVDAHLLDPAGPGRYQQHDLIRLFAAEVAPDDTTRPLIRALSHYVASARLASTTMDPHRVQPEADAVTAEPHHVSSPDEARAWLDREEPNLVAVAGQAMSSRDDRLARLGVALTFALFWYQHYAHQPEHQIALNLQALSVCERLGDRRGLYHAHGHVASGLSFQQRMTQVVEHLHAQLALAKELGDAFSEQRTLGNLANAENKLGGHERALSYASRQLLIARRIGAEVGVRYAHLMAGSACHGLDRASEAREHLEAAMAAAEAVGDTGQAGNIRMVLGEVCLTQDEPRTALEHLRQALVLNRTHGIRMGELRCLVRLSRACRMLGDARAALTHIGEGVPLARTMGTDLWLERAQEEQRAVHELLGVPVVHLV
ncbi:AfsR/SARP family transcriptional regulator [Nonomuraea sp. ZG12]|uniref:AfsR/SARP family transcriptional regulator n=1 Tax=Nonomuraea sp. ZG12 TaxID=3452207 RepID=UPI003F8C6F85